MTIDDRLGHGTGDTTSMGDPYSLSNPESLQPQSFTHQGEIVHGKENKPLSFGNLRGPLAKDSLRFTLHGAFPLLRSEGHLAWHYFSEIAGKDVSVFTGSGRSRTSESRESVPSFERKVRALVTEHRQFSFV